MRVVIVDTDVASFIFKGDTRGALYDPHIDEDDTLPAISFMTRAELEQWARPLRLSARASDHH
jgi:hypothetical protein